ncbi:MAG TPA: hypothetical protein VL689_20970 [Paraburkholderia sp.]|jgi:uncharacterized membrane protein|nr:hypothetical protein [Paraburkholderia sp.]
MKSVLPAAVGAALLALGSLAVAAPADDARAAVEAQSSSANEQAGLPDLAAINRPAAEVTSKVDVNVPRTPSYHEVSPTGTEITEYRDKGKPVEIDVKSNFGTRYQMSAPADTSPQVRDNGRATRLPSINLRY